jgi:hypothetical protein
VIPRAYVDDDREPEMVSHIFRISLLLGPLFLVAGMSFVLPAQAVPSNPKGDCFEVIGTDPNGVNHTASLYHNHQAKSLAASWIAEGWTDVMIGPC